MDAATFEPPLRPRAMIYGVSPADEQLLRLDHIDKSDRHTDDERRRDNAFLNQLMQTDERGRRVADGEDERTFKFGGVLHRNDCPRDTARLGLACHLLIRHQADRLSAELCQRRLAHPRRAPYWYR